MLEQKQFLKQIHIDTCSEEPYVTLENILCDIYIKKSVKTLDISETFNLPKPTAVAIRNELISHGFIEQANRKIILSERGDEFVRNILGYGSVCLDKYHKFTHGDSKTIEELSSKIQLILEQRPSVKFELDQAHCTVETLLDRVRLSLLNFDIIGRRILCIGDDDCLSIAITCVLKSIAMDKGDICDITVIDIDERLTQFIKTTGVNQEFPIDILSGDLRFYHLINLPQNIDTVFTDPPYTINGLDLFLSIANLSLEPIVGGKIYLSFGQKKIKELMEAQNLIHRKGFLIEKIIKKFNRYEGASILGRKSNMYYLIKTDLKNVPTVCNQNIYTYSNKNKNVT